MNINTITNSLIDKIILELNNHETKKKYLINVLNHF